MIEDDFNYLFESRPDTPHFLNTIQKIFNSILTFWNYEIPYPKSLAYLKGPLKAFTLFLARSS